MAAGSMTATWKRYETKGSWSAWLGFFGAENIVDELDAAFAGHPDLAYPIWTTDEDGNFTLKFQSPLAVDEAEDAARKVLDDVLPSSVESLTTSVQALTTHVVAPTVQQAATLAQNTAAQVGAVAKSTLGDLPTTLKWGAIVLVLYMLAG